MIYKDGRQSRDLPHVSDIVQANLLAMEHVKMDYGTFNVGTGHALAVLDIAQSLIQRLGSTRTSQITRTCRAGDIRHCVADIGRIQAMGYQPPDSRLCLYPTAHQVSTIRIPADLLAKGDPVSRRQCKHLPRVVL